MRVCACACACAFARARVFTFFREFRQLRQLQSRQCCRHLCTRKPRRARRSGPAVRKYRLEEARLRGRRAACTSASAAAAAAATATTAAAGPCASIGGVVWRTREVVQRTLLSLQPRRVVELLLLYPSFKLLRCSDPPAERSGVSWLQACAATHAPPWPGHLPAVRSASIVPYRSPLRCVASSPAGRSALPRLPVRTAAIPVDRGRRLLHSKGAFQHCPQFSWDITSTGSCYNSSNVRARV